MVIIIYIINLLIYLVSIKSSDEARPLPLKKCQINFINWKKNNYFWGTPDNSKFYVQGYCNGVFNILKLTLFSRDITKKIIESYKGCRMSSISPVCWLPSQRSHMFFDRLRFFLLIRLNQLVFDNQWVALCTICSGPETSFEKVYHQWEVE